MNIGNINKIVYPFSIERMGHHGIINWMCNHFDEPVVWVNHINTPPIRSKSFVEMFDKNHRQKFRFYDRHVNKNPDVYVNMHHATSKQIQLMPKISLVLSSANLPINQIGSIVHNDFADQKICRIYIIRDVYNCLASQLRVPQFQIRDKVHIYANLMSLIKRYYEHCLSCEQTDDSFYILYNQWFIDKEYRQSIIERMGLEFTDKGLNQRLMGFEYSVDNKTSRSQDMQVFDRWRQYKDHPFMKRLFQNKELVEMCYEIFKFRPKM